MDFFRRLNKSYVIDPREGIQNPKIFKIFNFSEALSAQPLSSSPHIFFSIYCKPLPWKNEGSLLSDKCRGFRCGFSLSLSISFSCSPFSPLQTMSLRLVPRLAGPSKRTDL
ncbi:hypothetical protein SLA2020_451960 [Shorea laevis]